jgi:hypothetical protein
MPEIHFIVEKAAEGGFSARAVGADIFTEADTLSSLCEQLRDALCCHFDVDSEPELIRILITRSDAKGE